jgi:hypothetical protein
VEGGRDAYWPFLFCWRSKGTKNGLKLIHVTLSREIWYAEHQLRKDAADRPDVNGGTVVAATKQQFRRPIPSGDTVRCRQQTTANKGTKKSKQDTPLQVIRGRQRRITETGRTESSGIPSDHLTGHFVSWVRRIAGQAKVCDLELSVRGNEQVVWLQILSCEKAYQNRSN